MVRKLLGPVVFCVLASAVVLAADFWETKPFSMWSAEELQKILIDSPWSRNVSVLATPPRVGAGGLGESDGGGGGSRGGGGGGGAAGADSGGGAAGGGGGRGGGGRGPSVPPQIKLVISWRTALPLKQALVRDQVGLGGAIPVESQQLLDRQEDQYVITLVGLPARYARALDSLKTETVLKRNKKPPIALTEMGVQQVPATAQAAATLVVVFAFPKTDPITLEDKDVEFVTKLGEIDIKKKFNLKDMVFHGHLEL